MNVMDLDGGLCAETDPELFFPEKGDHAKATAARKLCGSCPIQADCLEYALKVNVLGIWGATNHDERRDIRKARGLTVEDLSPTDFLVFPPQQTASAGAELTEDQVREIRWMRAEGSTAVDIHATGDYGVSLSTIQKLLRGYTYKWVV